MIITPLDIVFLICLLSVAFTSRTSPRRFVRWLWLIALISGLGIRVYRMHSSHVEAERNAEEKQQLKDRLVETAKRQEELSNSLVPRRLSAEEQQTIFLQLVGKGGANIARMWKENGQYRSQLINESHAYVVIETTIGDSAGILLANDIKQALEKASWSVNTSQVLKTRPTIGMGMLINTNAHPHTLLSAALLQSSLDSVSLVFDAFPYDVKTNEIVLFIGVKQ